MYAVVFYLPMLSSFLVLVSTLPVIISHHSPVVQLPPLIVREPPSVVLFTSQRKSHVDLRCDAQGSPQPVIRWRRRDAEPVPDTWLQSDGSLRLPADVSSAGFYQCLAENEVGTAMSNFTDVQSFDVPLYDVDKQLTVTEGDHVMLHCPLYASSLPVDITWLYPDYDAVTVDQTKAISDNGSLVMTWAEVTDSNTYRCRAEICSSEKICSTLYSHQYHLTVNARPDHQASPDSFTGGKWLAGTSSLTSLEGSDVTMSCICSGRVDRITWKRADERPILSNASSLSDFGRRLTILSAKSSDSGNYSCTAHYESRVDGSDAGTPTKTYVQLIVTTQLSVTGAKPRIVRPLISRNVSKPSEPVSFYCQPDPATVTTTSSATDRSQQVIITWYINAQPLIGDLDGEGGWNMSSDRTQLTLVDPRPCVVSCNVSNEHGSLLSTARLALLPPGYTETPEVTETVTQSHNLPPGGVEDADEQSFSRVAIVWMAISAFIFAAAVAAAAALVLCCWWRCHKQAIKDTQKEEETKRAAAAAGDAGQQEQQQDDDDDGDGDDVNVDEDDKSLPPAHSSLTIASQDSGIITRGDDVDADAVNVNAASEDDDVEDRSLLNRDDAASSASRRSIMSDDS